MSLRRCIIALKQLYSKRLAKGKYLVDFRVVPYGEDKERRFKRVIKADSEKEAQAAGRRLMRELQGELQGHVRGDVMVDSPKPGGNVVPFKPVYLTIREAFRLMEKTLWRDKKDLKGLALNADMVMRKIGYDTPVRDITTADLNEAVSEWQQEDGMSNATVNRKMAALSVTLRAAFEGKLTGKEELDKLPHIPRLREGRGRIRVLSSQEVEGIREFVSQLDKSQEDMGWIIEMLLDTGCRVSEIGDCYVRDYKPETGQFHIWVNKGDRPRTLPLTGRARDIMEMARLDAEGNVREDSELMFQGFTKHRMRHIWDKLRTHMRLQGDREFVPHCMRHTVATKLLEGGAGVYEVKEWLGHASVTMTERYIHMESGKLKGLVNILE